MVIAELADPLPADAMALVKASELEGYDHMRRFLDEWIDGSNRFQRPGEMALGAFVDGKLIAIGAMTIEFSRADWLWMRRFYVLPAYRRQGVARQVAGRLIDHARAHTPVITVHTGGKLAEAFWSGMGFRPSARANYTHILQFT